MSDSENTTEDGFLGRWSRRKLDNRSAAPLEHHSSDDLEGSLAEAQDKLAGNEIAELHNSDNTAEVADVDTTGQLLTDDDMPPIDSLDADSDYSPFFSEGVSKQLRNLALKKLFFSGKFALRDGLDDYDDDFTKFEPLGDTVTSDMKFHERRKEKARLLEEERLEQERKQREQEQLEQQTASDEDDTESDDTESDDADKDESLLDDTGQEQRSEDLPEPEFEFSVLPGTTPGLISGVGVDITVGQEKPALTGLDHSVPQNQIDEIPESPEHLRPEDEKRKLT